MRNLNETRSPDKASGKGAARPTTGIGQLDQSRTYKKDTNSSISKNTILQRENRATSTIATAKNVGIPIAVGGNASQKTGPTHWKSGAEPNAHAADNKSAIISALDNGNGERGDIYRVSDDHGAVRIEEDSDNNPRIVGEHEFAEIIAGTKGIDDIDGDGDLKSDDLDKVASKGMDWPTKSMQSEANLSADENQPKERETENSVGSPGEIFQKQSSEVASETILEKGDSKSHEDVPEERKLAEEKPRNRERITKGNLEIEDMLDSAELEKSSPANGEFASPIEDDANFASITKLEEHGEIASETRIGKGDLKSRKAMPDEQKLARAKTRNRDQKRVTKENFEFEEKVALAELSKIPSDNGELTHFIEDDANDGIDFQAGGWVDEATKNDASAMTLGGEYETFDFNAHKWEVEE
jgi:hypothetical protein